MPVPARASKKASMVPSAMREESSSGVPVRVRAGTSSGAFSLKPGKWSGPAGEGVVSVCTVPPNQKGVPRER